MDRLNLVATQRSIFGKKVKKLRKEGLLPGHVFGKKTETDHVSIDTKTFLKVFKEAGATGLIDLSIGEQKVLPVMIRGVQYDPVTGSPLHVDFYAVNLTEKVIVPVPITITGEEPESVHLGEAIVLQTLNEVSVEALPTDLIDNIEIDISTLQNIDDAITVAQLPVDRSKITILTPEEEIVVKLAPAVSEEMEELLEEQAAETEAVQTETTEGEEGEKAKGEAEGETPEAQEAVAEEKGNEGSGADEGQK